MRRRYTQCHAHTLERVPEAVEVPATRGATFPVNLRRSIFFGLKHLQPVESPGKPREGLWRAVRQSAQPIDLSIELLSFNLGHEAHASAIATRTRLAKLGSLLSMRVSSTSPPSFQVKRTKAAPSLRSWKILPSTVISTTAFVPL